MGTKTLKVMEEEFGIMGQASIMIENITIDRAINLKQTLINNNDGILDIYGSIRLWNRIFCWNSKTFCPMRPCRNILRISRVSTNFTKTEKSSSKSFSKTVITAMSPINDYRYPRIPE